MKQLALLAGAFPQDQLAGRRVQSVQPVPALLGRLFTDQPPNLGPLRALLRCSPLGLFGLVSGHRRLPLPTTHLVVLLLLEPVGVKLL